MKLSYDVRSKEADNSPDLRTQDIIYGVRGEQTRSLDYTDVHTPVTQESPLCCHILSSLLDQNEGKKILSSNKLSAKQQKKCLII